mgnify:CR=1 FL=1
MNRKQPGERIARFTLLGIIGLLVIGLGRVAQLELAPASELVDHLGRRTRTDKRIHWRGDIVDRRSRCLAMSELGYALAVDLKVMGDRMEASGLLPKPLSADASADSRSTPEYLDLWNKRLEQVADVLAEDLGLDRAEVLERMQAAGRGRRYCVLATEVDTDDPDYPRMVRNLHLEVDDVEKPWRIAGLVLDERPIRKVISDRSLAWLIGDVGAVDWYPPPAEYDRIPSSLRVDVPGYLKWAERNHPEVVDPVGRLAAGIAVALGDFFNDETESVTPRITLALEGARAGDPWRPDLPIHLLETRHRRALREITIAEDGRPVPRDLILEFEDLEALKVLRSRYPDQVGTSGIEWERNDTLRQQHGSLERTVAAGGDTLYLQSFERGRDGEQIQLTVDVNIQQIVRKRLEKAIEDHLAVGGWAIVADPVTGEILAAVDIFDNEEARRRGGWVEGMLDPRRDEVGPAHGRSRIWTDTYEPGSTFKTIFWAWSRHLDRVGGTEKVDIGSNNGKWFGKRRIEYIGRDEGPTEWRTCLLKSINTGFATVAQRMTDEELAEMCRSFGIGFPTGVQMGVDRNGPGRRIGSTPGPSLLQASRNGERLSMSFGYSVALSPLQLVRAYCAIARNDGRLPLMSIVSPGVRSFETPSFPTVRPEVALETREVLRQQFEKVRARVEKNGREPIPYTAFGKSGTAYLPRGDEDGNLAGYHKSPLPPRYLSSYVAGAPFDDPRIVVAVGIQDPQAGSGANVDISFRGEPTGHLGSYSAGRPAHDIIGAVLEMLGVPEDRDPGGDQSSG